MKHIHKYESITHLGVSEEAKAIGIKEAEIRKCPACGKETTFLLIKGNKWITLLKDEAADEQNILLA